jgi:carboxylesterase 2
MFLGVPFAQPPVGPLRFKDPVTFPLWTGERSATEFGPVCPQNFDVLEKMPFKVERPSRVSEDCLYLNVYTPTLARDAKLPVMFWICGGGFLLGSSNMYSGVPLSALHDVVYVSFNYRVGFSGFLCTGDSVATGNYGLLDQIEALRWVQSHIESFGGDPSNVTIFGQSAGGVSVSYLLMSPLARGLFKNAISESGTCLGTMGPIPTPAIVAASVRSFLKQMGCEAEKSEDILAFLTAQPAENLVIPTALMSVINLQPVVDGRCLVAMPDQVYAAGDAAKVNYVLGCNRDEGAFLVFGMSALLKQDISSLSLEMAQGFVANTLKLRYRDKDVTSLIAACIAEYFNDAEDSVEGRQRALVEFFEDMLFVYPTTAMAKLHAGLGSCSVYLYNFVARSAFMKGPTWVHATHASEIPSVLGLPFVRPDILFSEADRALSISMMKYWTNFARSGDPNSAGLPEWPLYNTDTKEHLTFDTLNICQSSKLRAERMHFWSTTAAKLLQN